MEIEKNLHNLSYYSNKILKMEIEINLLKLSYYSKGYQNWRYKFNKNLNFALIVMLAITDIQN